MKANMQTESNGNHNQNKKLITMWTSRNFHESHLVL